MQMPSVSERNSLEQATAAYERDIHLAEAYLASRGIPLAVANTYRLGYVTEQNVQPGDQDMIGRLALPFLTPHGVIDMRFRDIGGQSRAKYLSKPGSHTRIFAVGNLLKASPFVCITEGEFDTIIADGLCGLPSVGVPGASNWQPHYPLLFEDRQVFVLCDGDTAGREFGKKVAATVDGATIIPMPDGMDVNEVFLQYGASEIRKKVGIVE